MYGKEVKILCLKVNKKKEAQKTDKHNKSHKERTDLNFLFSS